MMTVENLVSKAIPWVLGLGLALLKDLGRTLSFRARFVGEGGVAGVVVVPAPASRGEEHAVVSMEAHGTRRVE